MQGESNITSFFLKLKIQIETFRGLLRFNLHGGHLDYSIIILCNDNNNILVQHTAYTTHNFVKFWSERSSKGTRWCFIILLGRFDNLFNVTSSQIWERIRDLAESLFGSTDNNYLEMEKVLVYILKIRVELKTFSSFFQIFFFAIFDEFIKSRACRRYWNF